MAYSLQVVNGSPDGVCNLLRQHGAGGKEVSNWLEDIGKVLVREVSDSCRNESVKSCSWARMKSRHFSEQLGRISLRLHGEKMLSPKNNAFFCPLYFKSSFKSYNFPFLHLILFIF
ncbi:hypothetical protein PBY51_022849 [Eleginops maclovinus]|uniref:Uncharacterized protein n=1 Tax=Eleginops maclovinus TaxID=56733 RepID=A0AAN7XDW1_ELEMC|nr:hypothetical protein PBY51_022849 [Eleginops maclovinus]